MSDQDQRPGRPGIKESEYHQQIKTWLDQGVARREITAGRLANVVGGRHGKAKAILQAYWQANPEEVPAPRQLGAELQQAVAGAVGGIWQALQDETATRVAEVEEAASEAMSAANEAAEAGQAAADQAQGEIVQLKARVDEKTVALRHEQARADNLEADLKTARGVATELSNKLQAQKSELAVAITEKRQAQAAAKTLGTDNQQLKDRLSGAVI